jgi:hypothetical protein
MAGDEVARCESMTGGHHPNRAMSSHRRRWTMTGVKGDAQRRV